MKVLIFTRPRGPSRDWHQNFPWGKSKFAQHCAEPTGLDAHAHRLAVRRYLGQPAHDGMVLNLLGSFRLECLKVRIDFGVDGL